MHAEPATGHASPEAPPPVEPPSAGEWAIGIGFVLAALALVAYIGWSLWTLAP